MKLNALFPIVSLAILGFAAPSSQAIPILTVQAPVGPVVVGSTVTINIAVSDATDLYGFQFDLEFDPTFLAASDPTEGAFLASGGNTFFIPGVVNGSIISATANTLLTAISGVNGNGILASFSFIALNEGATALSLSGITLLDSGLNTLESLAENAIVTINPRSTDVPEPATLTLLMLGLLVLRGAAVHRAKCSAPFER